VLSLQALGANSVAAGAVARQHKCVSASLTCVLPLLRLQAVGGRVEHAAVPQLGIVQLRHAGMHPLSALQDTRPAVVVPTLPTVLLLLSCRPRHVSSSRTSTMSSAPSTSCACLCWQTRARWSCCGPHSLPWQRTCLGFLQVMCMADNGRSMWTSIETVHLSWQNGKAHARILGSLCVWLSKRSQWAVGCCCLQICGTSPLQE
jgi:hypothetical protein